MSGLIINLTNSVLYMANYNLIVPSIRSFMEHVGGDAAASGLALGCCDLGALCASIGESFWDLLKT